MSILFSASEAVSMAVEIEKNGVNFYNTLAAETDDEQSKELFSFLAAEEVKHKIFFRKMLENLPEVTLSPAEEEEYGNYLGALAKSRIFTPDLDPMELLNETKNNVAAIDLAIEFEKDSILFFYELMEQAIEEDKKVIEELIKEEKSHFSRLIVLKSRLTQ